MKICLPWGLPPAILNGSDFLRNSSKCPVNLVSKNGLKCCCCPVKINWNCEIVEVKCVKQHLISSKQNVSPKIAFSFLIFNDIVLLIYYDHILNVELFT